MIKRMIEPLIRQDFGKGKVVLVLGARQVGKTTLLQQLSAGVQKSIMLNCDNADDLALLANPTTTSLAALVGDADILLIDEAQRVDGIGLVLKMLADTVGTRTQVVATGSSALELANGVFESAAGRVFEYRLYPFSFGELAEDEGGARIERRLLESRLVWGAYPEVATTPNDARRILEAIVNGALYKDILSFGGIRRSDVLGRLLQCLALQVGSEVSYGELAAAIGINKATVETYIDLLEKTFVVFRLPSLARNARNEIKKGRKVYFWDNGIRNAVIGNFSPLALRMDAGALWENYLVSERRKALAYSRSAARSYFWRTTTQSEVDYVEERDGCFAAYEFKWNIRRKPRPPSAYLAAYPQSDWKVVTPENYQDFLHDAHGCLGMKGEMRQQQ